MAANIAIENSQQYALIATSALSIFIATFLVGLRLIAKTKGVGFDRSDYCIVAALLWNNAMHTCCLVLTTHGGFGFHLADVYQRFGPDTVTFFFKGIMSFALLWNCTVCFSKLSVLLMYVAIVPTPSMMNWTKGIGITVIAWNSSDIVAGFLICRPLAKNWNPRLPGSCGSQPNFYFAMGIINLVMDLVILVLPMPYLIKLHMPMRRKLLAMGLLSIGIGVWVITIYRQTLLPTLDYSDMTHSGVLATIFSGLEPAVAIGLACRPLMRPLFSRESLESHCSSHDYDTNRKSGLYFPKGSKHPSKDPTSTFSKLYDDNDDSSQIQLQLQPLPEDSPVVDVSAVVQDSQENWPIVSPGQAIRVKKTWEVSRN